jgi:asparagine N-glycosylation enzyme membrane subunit Stt3
VFFGPFAAALTSIAIYFFTMEATSGDIGSSLISTIFMATLPGYISVSVAGKFGSESLVAFLFISTLTLWLKSVITGRITWIIVRVHTKN